MTSSNPIPTYIISVKLTDSTDSLWVRLYGENALPIMNGMTPDKFKQYLNLGDETREQEIKELLTSLNFRQFSVLVKPSVNDYNGQQSISFFGSKVFDFSYKKSNDFLIERLKIFEDKEDVKMED